MAYIKPKYKIGDIVAFKVRGNVDCFRQAEVIFASKDYSNPWVYDLAYMMAATTKYQFSVFEEDIVELL